jgi:predicted nucleic acid-binding protein
LLTGDQALKAVALAENVSVMGTLWLIRAMVENQLLNVDAAFAALARMKARNRRLPWGDAERILNSLR